VKVTWRELADALAPCHSADIARRFQNARLSVADSNPVSVWSHAILTLRFLGYKWNEI
jgi:hypothetical protein